MAITTTLKAAAEAVASSLGRLIDTVVDAAVDSKTFTISRVLDVVPDEEALRDRFLYNPTTPQEWRRINAVSGPNVVCVQDFTNPPVDDAAVQIYSILNPSEWRDAVNIALPKLYFEDRVSIPLVANTNLYTPTSADWLQSEGQILRYYFRDITSGATNIEEVSVPAVRPIEEDNALSFYLLSTLADITNVSLVVVAKHPFDKLTSDAGTTKCPYDLLIGQSKIEALKLIWNRLGSARAKQLFGMHLVTAERELNQAKARWLPMATGEELRMEEAWLGVDTAGIPTVWSW